MVGAEVRVRERPGFAFRGFHAGRGAARRDARRGTGRRKSHRWTRAALRPPRERYPPPPTRRPDRPPADHRSAGGCDEAPAGSVPYRRWREARRRCSQWRWEGVGRGGGRCVRVRRGGHVRHGNGGGALGRGRRKWGLVPACVLNLASCSRGECRELSGKCKKNLARNCVGSASSTPPPVGTGGWKFAGRMAQPER